MRIQTHIISSYKAKWPLNLGVLSTTAVLNENYILQTVYTIHVILLLIHNVILLSGDEKKPKDPV